MTSTDVFAGASVVLGVVVGKLAVDTRKAVVFLRTITAVGVENLTVVVSGVVGKSVVVLSLVAETFEIRIEQRKDTNIKAQNKRGIGAVVEKLRNGRIRLCPTEFRAPFPSGRFGV